MTLSNSFSLSILAMLLILASGYLKLGVEAVIATILTINQQTKGQTCF